MAIQFRHNYVVRSIDPCRRHPTGESISALLYCSSVLYILLFCLSRIIFNIFCIIIYKNNHRSFSFANISELFRPSRIFKIQLQKKLEKRLKQNRMDFNTILRCYDRSVNGYNVYTATRQSF